MKLVTINTEERLCDLAEAGFMILGQAYTSCNHACLMDALLVQENRRKELFSYELERHH